MSKQFMARILIIIGCSTALFMLATLLPQPSAAAVCKDDKALPKMETAGTLLLWESLSHQFLSNVQY